MARAIRLLIASLVLGFIVVHAAPGQAAITGANEPAFTRTPANNAFWWQWTAVPGADFNGNTVDVYWLCFRAFENGVLVEDSNHTNGPGSQNCTGDLTPPPSGATGATLSRASLADGVTYEMCATGAYPFFGINRSDLVSSNACPRTTIDRNPPQASVSVNNGAAFTRDRSLMIRIGYADATSPAWPANYLCTRSGGPCTNLGDFSYQPVCSNPLGAPAGLTNAFDCTVDVAAFPDGPASVCTVVADSAIPDNPTGPNQFVLPNGQPVNSSAANLSPAACTSVIVDRTPPQVSVRASRATIRVGDAVTFTADRSDAGSGPDTATTWTFSDNPGIAQNTSAGGVGRTFTTPGTYTVTASVRDRAGNDGSGALTVTVVPQPPGTATTPTTPGTPTTPTTPGTPGPGAGTGGASTGTTTTTAGGSPGAPRLRVTAPRRHRLTARTRTVAVVLRAATAGTATVSLRRGRRVLVSATSRLPAGRARRIVLRLPARLAPGTYGLRVRFRAATGTTTATRTLVVFRPAARRQQRRSVRVRGVLPPGAAVTALQRRTPHVPFRRSHGAFGGAS